MNVSAPQPLGAAPLSAQHAVALARLCLAPYFAPYFATDGEEEDPVIAAAVEGAIGRIAEMLLLVGRRHWRPIETAPQDGFGFLAYGRHAADCPLPGANRWRKGDHWWAIVQWDIWREPHQWVFGKDGRPLREWGEPLLWQPLEPPEQEP